MNALTLQDDPRLISQLSKAENRPLREAHAYWSGKIVDGRLPSRRDIDATEIPRLLPNLFLLDVVSGTPTRYRFRLVGTRIAQIEGEHRGRYLDEYTELNQNPAVLRHYKDACRGVVYLRDNTLYWQDRDHVDYTVLLLPLAEDGVTVDALLGYALYRNA
jgi:hypothetical protein